MRVRTQSCLVAMFMLILGAQPRLEATKQATPYTAKEVIGIWIGFDSDQLTFNRLDLRADSTGFLARVSPADTILHDQGVKVYRIHRWSLSGSNMEITMTPNADAYKIANIRGRMSLASMMLTMGGPEDGGWKEVALLSPESRIMASNDETKKTIDKVETK